MKLLFGSFWRAVAYCLHPKVLMLSLLPLVVAGVITLGGYALFWESALDAVRSTLDYWQLTRFMLDWTTHMLGAGFRTVITQLILMALSIPIVVALTLVLAGLWVTPAVVTMVARRRFPALERRHGGSWWLGAFAALAYTVASLLAVMVTLPFWLIPGLALVLPPIIWGWLTARVMGFDALAEHASQPEREAILRAHRGPFLGMGVVCGFLCGVPSLTWALSAGLLVAAPFVMVGVIWLYTLIFTFSALWFTHYALAVLAQLREAEAAMRAVQPVVAPSSDLQLVEEVPPQERFGYEDSRPLES